MSRPSGSASIGALYAACFLASAACGDGQKARKLGMTCEATADCVEGICGGGLCIDPTGDDDGDQLTNEFEVGLGTNPINADTDNDGAGDKAELENLSLVDIDGDTIPDALESRTADADGDCLPDQYDPQNHVSNDDLTGLIPIACRVTGVCSDIKNLRVLCDRGRGAQVAPGDDSHVPSVEATEAACDALDNDCDGVTDDGASDLDADEIADCVDPDDDGDGLADADDDCPIIADPDQIDSDGDALGDVCDPPRPPVVGGIAPASPSNDTTPTLTGLADANAQVAVFDDSDCTVQLATVTADPSGQFTAEVVVAGEGLHRHYLRAENAATLRSACLPSGLPYVLDTIAPAPPVFTNATPPSPSTDPTPFIEGTAEAGARVTLGLGQEAFIATADASGKWAVTVAIDAPGDWPFSGTATDAAGNVSALVSLFAYSLRSDAPAPPYLSGNPFSPPSPSNAANPRVAITLCAPAGTRVAFWSGGCGASLLGEVDATSDLPCPTGTGVVVTLPDVGLPADATSTIFAQSIGVGELVSACVPVGAYVDDTVAPAAPALVASDPTGPFAFGLAHMLLTVAPRLERADICRFMQQWQPARHDLDRPQRDARRALRRPQEHQHCDVRPGDRPRRQHVRMRRARDVRPRRPRARAADTPPAGLRAGVAVQPVRSSPGDVVPRPRRHVHRPRAERARAPPRRREPPAGRRDLPRRLRRERHRRRRREPRDAVHRDLPNPRRRDVAECLRRHVRPRRHRAAGPRPTHKRPRLSLRRARRPPGRQHRSPRARRGRD